MENGLKLILRSHEGPDARFEREDMASMLEGWTLDHQVPAGKLMTIFRFSSAPRLHLPYCLSFPGWPMVPQAQSNNVPSHHFQSTEQECS